VLKKSTAMLVLFIAQAIMAFFTNVIVARNLDLEEFGVYSFWVATMTLLAVPACLGFDVYVAREGAGALERGQMRKAAGLFLLANAAALGATLLIAIGVVGYALRQLDGTSAFWPWPAVFAAAALPFLSLNLIRQRISATLGAVLSGSLAERLVRPGVLLVGTWGVFHFALGEPTPAVALAVFMCAAISSFAIGWTLLHFAKTPDLGHGPPEFLPREWLVAAAPMAILSTAQIVNRQADVVMLGLLASPEEVGVYQVASRLAILLGFVYVAFSTVIVPRLARLWAAEKRAEMQTLTTTASFVSCLITGLGVLAIFLIGRPVIELVFGHDYGAAIGPLRIVAIGILINAATGPSVAIMSMTEHAGVATRFMLLTMFVNIGANLAAIPILGIYGAALATAFSYFFFNAILVMKCRKLVGINPLAISPVTWELLKGKRKWPL